MNIKELHNFDKFKYPIIRVYLDNIKDIKEKNHKLNELFKNFTNLVLFGKIFFSSDEDLKKISKSLEKRKLKFLNFSFYLDIKEEEYIERIIISCINRKIISKLNKVVLEKDFSIAPELYMDIYYFDNKNNILINPYDDRGVDFIFLKTNDNNDNVEKIQKIIDNKYKYELLLVDKELYNKNDYE